MLYLITANMELRTPHDMHSLMFQLLVHRLINKLNVLLILLK